MHVFGNCRIAKLFVSASLNLIFGHVCVSAEQSDTLIILFTRIKHILVDISKVQFVTISIYFLFLFVRNSHFFKRRAKYKMYMLERTLGMCIVKYVTFC